MWLIFKKSTYSNNFLWYGLVRAANDLSLKDAESGIFAIYINEKANIRVIYYVVKWIKTLSLSVSSFSLFFSYVCIFVF